MFFRMKFKKYFKISTTTTTTLNVFLYCNFLEIVRQKNYYGYLKLKKKRIGIFSPRLNINKIFQHTNKTDCRSKVLLNKFSLQKLSSKLKIVNCSYMQI